jgi:hypothetical protein
MEEERRATREAGGGCETSDHIAYTIQVDGGKACKAGADTGTISAASSSALHASQGAVVWIARKLRRGWS